MTLDLDQVSSSAELVARLVVIEMSRAGVSLFVISPGARCIPLIEAVKHLNLPYLLINDERAAAYFAYGYSKEEGKLAALICTSGTAIANYMPAVVEAYVAGVPLVVITADRPNELHYASANQTIEQGKSFSTYVKKEINIAAYESRVYSRSILANVDQLVFAAKTAFRGPVVLNIAFRKPFSSQLGFKVSEEDLCEIRNWQNSNSCLLDFVETKSVLSEKESQKLLEDISLAKNPLFIFGPAQSGTNYEDLSKILVAKSYTIFADFYSNLRHQNRIISSYNLFLDELFKKGVVPDLVCYFGARPISERLRKYLEGSNSKIYLFSESSARQDTLENEYYRVNKHFSALDNNFLLEVFNKLPEASDSAKEQLIAFKDLDCAAKESLKRENLNKSTFSESLAIEMINETFYDCDIYTSPSLLSRELEHFYCWHSSVDSRHKTQKCLGNRGVSGIDGIIASACGYSFVSKKRLILLIGDQACWHDLSSLSIISQFDLDLHVIVFNNNGGAVFDLLKTEDISSELANRHNKTFLGVRDLFGVKYSKCDSLGNFKAQIEQIKKADSSTFTELTFSEDEAAKFFAFKI